MTSRIFWRANLNYIFTYINVKRTDLLPFEGAVVAVEVVAVEWKGFRIFPSFEFEVMQGQSQDPSWAPNLG